MPCGLPAAGGQLGRPHADEFAIARMTWLARLSSFFLLLVLVVLGLYGLDALSAPVTTFVRTPSPAHEASLVRGRAFVLFIDSLRYETAVSKALMPHLAALRGRGVYARVTPTRDAVTVPCVRAAFTGRDRTRVLGFVANFLKGNAGIESIFTQLAAAGRRGAAYSDGAFNQFGEVGIDLLQNGDPEPEEGEAEDRRDHMQEQNATVATALHDYHARKHDLVVMHVTYTDHVAHERGIHDPVYAARFAAADALVERLDREIGPSDTFIVLGDHGHDPSGRHALGLEVPTFLLYRGPRFVAGTDLGTVSLRDHRALMGYALGLPLPADYAAGRHPEALRSAGPLPSDYATPERPLDAAAPGVPPARRLAYFGSVVLIGVLLIGFMLFVASHARDLYALTPWRPRTWFSLLLAALSICALGASFPGMRSFVHEPTYAMLAWLWVAYLGLAVTLVRARRDVRHGWALLIAPLVISFPTVYRYGAPAAMGPAWFGWLLCLALGAGAAADPVDEDPRLATSRAQSFWLVSAALALLLAPFAALEAINFRFTEWVLWPLPGLPQGWFWLALCAKLAVFVQPRAPRGHQFAGLCACALLTLAQQGLFSLNLQCVAGLLLLMTALGLRLGRLSFSARPLETMAVVLGVLLLHHGSVRIPSSAYAWQDCLLAALVLSGRLARELPPRLRGQAWALLLFFAFFAAGWVSFAWTVHQLEWGFLYDWLSAAFVERQVLWLLPLILGRYALPLVAARRLLARELADASSVYPHGLVRLLVGGKVLSLLLWAYGIAYVTVASDLYLEAVQETGIAVVLWAGLL
jgi:hypothetical protein